LTSNQGFDSLANMSGKMVAFIPHATNGATVTLNVDGLGAKALRSAPSVELPAGVLIQGTPYCAVYNNSTTEWILQGFWGANEYSIPLGAGVPYFGTSAPNSKFAFPSGQAISRSTYAALFALIGTAYGSGDGSTTFNLPGVGGRLLACRENMNGAGAEGRITTALRHRRRDARRRRRRAERHARHDDDPVAQPREQSVRSDSRARRLRPDPYARSRRWRHKLCHRGRRGIADPFGDRATRRGCERCRGRYRHQHQFGIDRHQHHQRRGRRRRRAQQHAAHHDGELHHAGAVSW
jgi:hypothetical protein